MTNWEQFIRRLLDEGHYDVYLSGSSAKLLSREIASSMRGRAWEVEIFPFSFQEALKHKKRHPNKSIELLTNSQRSKIDHYFEEYLITGGLPEAQSFDKIDRFQLLQGYVDALLMRFKTKNDLPRDFMPKEDVAFLCARCNPRIKGMMIDRENCGFGTDEVRSHAELGFREQDALQITE